MEKEEGDEDEGRWGKREYYYFRFSFSDRIYSSKGLVWETGGLKSLMWGNRVEKESLRGKEQKKGKKNWGRGVHF